MSDIVVSVENLSKRYIIGHQKQGRRYVALRDVLSDGVRRIGKRLVGKRDAADAGTREEFWALKDVSFEIKRGECVGIVGRNGAGKSTLLKILSRITDPTSGRIKLKGRVASLLEVGTGFHPELTGRENIFLNGAILGMRREEIKSKFDEIVAFAETEKFLDTPVKHYSSGMYMRLAFAVAAHLEPEILIVDEVLAVGDAQFQKKCLGKMNDVAKQGRTVLFVSHNLHSIRNLCQKGVVLRKGRSVYCGDVANAISNYRENCDTKPETPREPYILYEDKDLSGKMRLLNEIEIVRIALLDDNEKPVNTVHTWDTVRLRLTYRVTTPLRNVHFCIEIDDAQDQRLMCLETRAIINRNDLGEGDGNIDCRFEKLPLAAGEFGLTTSVYILNQRVVFHSKRIATLRVEPADLQKNGQVHHPSHYAPVVPDYAWISNKLDRV